MDYGSLQTHEVQSQTTRVHFNLQLLRLLLEEFVFDDLSQ